MPKLSIIIPCYNEQKTIEEVLSKVKGVELPQGWGREIIVVDDGSKDNSREILKKLENEVKVIFKEINQGKGSALKEGFKVASGDYILIQDADLELNPHDYPKLLEPIIKGESEIVIGSRLLGKSKVPFYRFHFYGGVLITKIFNLFLGTKLTDVPVCYKLFPQRLVDRLISLPSNDFVMDIVELTHQLSLSGKIVEVPISYQARSKKEGKKLNWRHGVKCFKAILRIRFFNG